MHGVQSGVAAKMELDPTETTPKHLRVGVNSAMVQHAALVRLLMSKGIVTEAEYWADQADAADEERERYEHWLTLRTGVRVTLS